MARRKRRTFSAEQKQAAVDRSKALENISLVAKELDLNPALLGRWIKEADSKAQSNNTKLVEDEHAELVRLRAENKKLKQERDFLEKASAFFATKSKHSI